MRTGPADRPAALIPVVDWATRLDFGLHSIASERCRAAAAKPENGEAAAIYACAWVTPRHPTRRSGKLSVQKRSTLVKACLALDPQRFRALLPTSPADWPSSRAVFTFSKITCQAQRVKTHT